MYKLPDTAHYMDIEFAEYLIKKGEPYETMRGNWKEYTLREILEAVYNRGYHHGYDDGHEDGIEDQELPF